MEKLIIRDKANKRRLREAAVRAGIKVPPRISKDKWDNIFDARDRGQMLASVKAIKEAFMCGLKDAKHFHDGWGGYGIKYKEQIKIETLHKEEPTMRGSIDDAFKKDAMRGFNPFKVKDTLSNQEQEEYDNFIEIEGNLLDMFDNGDFDIIAHGCNCHQAMFNGIAAQIARRFPKAKYMDDQNYMSPQQKLGNMSVAQIAHNGTILNLYSQFNPGKDLNMTALELALWKVNHLYPGHHIGLPLIGCGIAGGDWSLVKPLIKRMLKDMRVTIVHYKA